MTAGLFVKRYGDPDRCQAAARHAAWLLAHTGGAMRLPRIHRVGRREIVMEHLDGRCIRPAELGDIATMLGRFHAAAHHSRLRTARLDRAFEDPSGLVIPDFVTPRRDVLAQAGVAVDGLPAALYKDANRRNFLITPHGVAAVDFDDLTLAPFGYDLAKLVVSAAMTHGPLPEQLIDDALDRYNDATACLGPTRRCERETFDRYATVHHLLTAPYLGRNGYRHLWPDVCPQRGRSMP